MIGNETIQDVTTRDYSTLMKVSTLHERVTPQGFMVGLGLRFLLSFYESIISCSSTFLIVAMDEKSKILGFIAGSDNTKSLYKHLIFKHFLGVAIPVSRRILQKRTMKKIIESLFYPSRTNHSGLPREEILNFCVHPDHQGSGISQLLFSSAVQHFRTKGATSLKVAASVDQKRALGFCNKVNASFVGDLEIHKGHLSKLFRYDFP